MAALRAFMFERVYLGPEATREHAKIDLVIRTLFDHYCSHPDEIPASIPDADLGRRVTDHIAGMTDRFCLAQFEALTVPVAFAPVSRYTADSRDRVRDAVDMVALVEAKVELRRAGRQQLLRPLPVPRRAHRIVPRQPRREALPLLRLLGVGRPVRLRDADRGARLQGRARVARRPLRRHARERGGGSGRRGPARPERAPVRAARPARRPTTRATCGRRGEAADARDYLLGRGFSEETLREFRVGYAPRAWERLVRASRQAGYSDEELLAAGLAQRRQGRPGRSDRPLPRPDHVPDGRRARPRPRLRGAHDGPRPRSEVPEHRRRATSTTSARCSTGSRSRAPPPRRRGGWCSSRATPT